MVAILEHTGILISPEVERIKSIWPSCRGCEGDQCVLNIGGNKARLVAWAHFGVRRHCVKVVLTHAGYDEGKWK